MNPRSQPAATPALHPDAVVGQYALRLTAHLHRGAQGLPRDITERLRVAREQACARARQMRLAARGAGAVQTQGGGAAALGGPPSLWLRLASVLPLMLLVVGLLLIQHRQTLEQIHAAAEIDTALLGDTLPPTAYGDPGFVEYLRDAAMH